MGRPKKAAAPLLENEHVKELLSIMEANSAAHCEEVDTYSRGFTLGALLMLEVMEKKEAIINA